MNTVVFLLLIGHVRNMILHLYSYKNVILVFKCSVFKIWPADVHRYYHQISMTLSLHDMFTLVEMNHAFLV